MTNKTTNSYSSLSEFSEMLFGLSSMLKKAGSRETFDKLSPRITYETHKIRNMEIVLREGIFTEEKADEMFDEVDRALSDSEYVMQITDADDAENFGKNLIVSETVENAAKSARKMYEDAMAGREIKKGRQAKLDEKKPISAALLDKIGSVTGRVHRSLFERD